MIIAIIVSELVLINMVCLMVLDFQKVMRQLLNKISSHAQGSFHKNAVKAIEGAKELKKGADQAVNIEMKQLERTKAQTLIGLKWLVSNVRAKRPLRS